MLENFLGFTLENVANVSRRKLGVVGGRGGDKRFQAKTWGRGGGGGHGIFAPTTPSISYAVRV